MVRSLRIIAACATFVATGALGQNLVTNGSFELPAVGAGGFVVGAIPDWTLVSGSGAEVQNNAAGAAYAGSQLVELDGYDNSWIEQSVPVTPGATYQFAWAYSPRPNVALASNPVDVLVNGTIVLTNTGDGTGNAGTVWTTHQTQIVAAGSSIVVGFRGSGTSDAVGGYIDDVSLTLVKPPRSAAPVDATSDAMLALIALMLAAVGVLGLSRRE